MLSNKVLAIVIVLVLLLSFIGWIVGVGVTLFAGSPFGAALLFIPGALFYGFAGLVVKRLYDCDEQLLKKN
jgi:hypothetical protein